MNKIIYIVCIIFIFVLMTIPKWYLPKKLILLFDIILCFISLLLAYLIRFDFIDFYDLFWIKEYDTVIIGVPFLIYINYLSFILGKTINLLDIF